jgi:hypothetical protein
MEHNLDLDASWNPLTYRFKLKVRQGVCALESWICAVRQTSTRNESGQMSFASELRSRNRTTITSNMTEVGLRWNWSWETFEL